MIIAGIVLLATVLLSIVIIAFSDENCDLKPGIILTTAGVFGAMLLAKGIEAKHPKPTAIDVYQGHTTLEYTVVEGQAIDSTVVFNKEYMDSLENPHK